MGEVYFAGLSFEQVVREFKTTVGSVCVMRLNNSYDAEDCFQNTFLRLHKKSPDFESKEHLKAWLIRVAINECKRYMLKNHHFISLDKVNGDFVEFEQEKCDMSWALMKLDVKYRDVLYLYYCEEYKVNEIAQILGKSPNTIKTLLSRGREKLKTIYGGDE